jgi:hypothetical protein
MKGLRLATISLFLALAGGLDATTLPAGFTETIYSGPSNPTIFGDVACATTPFVDWINELKIEGLTDGCGGGNYCPAAATPREQMATFLVRTFNLPWAKP